MSFDQKNLLILEPLVECSPEVSQGLHRVGLEPVRTEFELDRVKTNFPRFGVASFRPALLEGHEVGLPALAAWTAGPARRRGLWRYLIPDEQQYRVAEAPCWFGGPLASASELP